MSLLSMLNEKQNALTEEINDMAAFSESEAFTHIPDDERAWHVEQLYAKIKESDLLALETIAEIKRNREGS